jgi:transposase
MAWFRVHLSEEEQRIVGEERREHPHEPTRRKMEVLWLLHHGLTREQAAGIAGFSVATVKRYANAFRDGGLEGLRCWKMKGRTGPLDEHRELLAESFREQPVSSVAEAADRIEQLTGIRRGLSQTRQFLKKLGLRWQRIAAIPVPPKKVSRNMWRSSSSFSLTN